MRKQQTWKRANVSGDPKPAVTPVLPYGSCCLLNWPLNPGQLRALNNSGGISSVSWDSEAASLGQGDELISVSLQSRNQSQFPAIFFCFQVTRTCGVFTWL